MCNKSAFHMSKTEDKHWQLCLLSCHVYFRCYRLWVLARSTSWVQSFPPYKRERKEHNLTCESLLQLCQLAPPLYDVEMNSQSLCLTLQPERGTAASVLLKPSPQIVLPYVVDTQTPGVTELRRRRGTNTFYFSRLPLMSWEDGRRCRWRGRDSVPAHGEWCCLPHLNSV